MDTKYLTVNGMLRRNNKINIDFISGHADLTIVVTQQLYYV